jgi:PAS domain S-box-containing protein
MRPSLRSPYLLAYPLVILSAWIWGLAGSAGCASTAGVLIEYFIYHEGQIDISPAHTGWLFRACIFLLGSIVAGVLTQTAAAHRQRLVNARFEEQLALAQAKQAVMEERDRAAALARENDVRVQLALDGANVGLWEWDMETDKSNWSTGFYRLHGLPADSETTYDIWRSVVDPDDRERVDKELERAVQDGGAFFSEYRVTLPEGEVRWVACQGSCVFETGKPRRMVGYCGDVTRRKQADIALLQAEKLAVAGRLSASIAHEINNPLEAALNLVYLASEADKREEQQRYLSDATDQLSRVSQISKQTLRFSRSSQRAIRCSVSELVKATVELVRPKAIMASVEIIEEARADPAFICFPGEIQQILVNIINNAIEATRGPGRVRIRISESVRWNHREEPGARITIADTGSGMSRETLARMHDAFFTTKDGTGTGLGMWVVSELINRHRGALSVRSSVHPLHRGTVMSIFIPGALAEEDFSNVPPANLKAM